MRQPEALLVIARPARMKRVEGLERDDLARIRVDGVHRVDGEDLRTAQPARIRRDRVFVLGLIEQNGFGGLRKQVDYRRAPEPERLRGDADLEPFPAVSVLRLRDQKHQFGAILESRRPDLLEAGNIEEEQLLRERAELLQQPGSPEGS